MLILAGDHVYKMNYCTMFECLERDIADPESGRDFGTTACYWQAHMDLLD